VVGDVESSTDVVDSVSRLLAEHSLCYDLAGKPCSELFVTNAHPNISVFDSLSTHSFLSVLEKHGNAVPLVAKLASAIFLTNGNDKVYQAFWHLEELEMLPKENLTTLPIGAMVNSGASFPVISFSDFVCQPKNHFRDLW
jgi:hypothetical protein